MADGSTGGRTRRRWSVARKAAILAELGEPGATLSVVGIAGDGAWISPQLVSRCLRRTCQKRRGIIQAPSLMVGLRDALAPEGR